MEKRDASRLHRIPATCPAVAALAGATVQRLAVDDSATFVLRRADGTGVQLRIDGSFALVQGGVERRGSPEAGGASAAPLLELISERVRQAMIEQDGSLALEFANGARLHALPEDHHMAWQVTDSTGRSAACLAEGQVVIR